MRRDNRISEILSTFALALAPSVAAILIAGGSSARDNFGIPVLYGYSLLYVSTDSMVGFQEDSLPQGTGVLVRKVQPSTLCIGDVVTFYDRRIEAMNTHRLVAAPVYENGMYRFHTMGDNRKSALYSYEGERFTEKELLGKVEVHSDAISFLLASFSPSISAMAETMGNLPQAFLFPLFTLLPLGIFTVVATISGIREWFREEEEQSKRDVASLPMQRLKQEVTSC